MRHERHIKSADEHIEDITKLHKKLSREELEFKRKQAELEDYEDLRDDVVAALDNSGVSDEIIHSRCGPHPMTIGKWRQKKTRKPQLGKMQSALRTVGKDLGIIDGPRR